MSELMLEKLNEAQRICVDHLRQAQVLGVSFAEYCRSFDLDLAKWYRVKQALARKGITVTAMSVSAAETGKVDAAASRLIASAWVATASAPKIVGASAAWSEVPVRGQAIMRAVSKSILHRIIKS